MAATSMTQQHGPATPARVGSGHALAEQDLPKHVHMVRSMARRLARRLPRHVSPDDLASAGCLGLLTAASSFRADTGCSFLGYARIKAHAAMLDELRELDVLPRRTRARLNRLHRTERRLLAEFGRPPTMQELADAEQIPLAAVEQAVSLEHQAANGQPLDGAESPADPAPGVLAAVEEKEQRVTLRHAVSLLPHRQREVITQYYQQDRSLKDIGAALGVSESRACQIHAEALKALRRML